MVRVKTITKEGKEFFSPFVFEWNKAERLVKSVTKWNKSKQKNTKYELIPCDSYPLEAVWNEEYADVIDLRVAVAEAAWERRSNVSGKA